MKNVALFEGGIGDRDVFFFDIGRVVGEFCSFLNLEWLESHALAQSCHIDL